MMWNAKPGQRTRTLVFAVAVCLAAVRAGASGEQASRGAHVLLDVPYVSQTPELCGGAAVAMVLRYWGEQGVFAQDFVSFVGPGAGGIVTGTLAAAVRDRGWQAVILPTAEDTGQSIVGQAIDAGRPLIALIEVAPQTYHYVVIVGSTGRDVVVHDPARAPFRVLSWAEFDRLWAPSRRWVMLVLPPERGTRAVTPDAPEPVGVAATTPCAALVERSLDLSAAGDATGAEQGLAAATELCPRDPAPWRELAGLRFSQSRWAESRDLANVAVRLAPEDTYAWQLVASSRYLTGDTSGALAAWNRAGEPRIDLIAVRGAARTNHSVIVHATGLQPRQMLTPEGLRRALRRLRDVPVASTVGMTYVPLDAGLARIDVAVAERKLLPSGWLAYTALGAKALVRREVALEGPGPSGGGALVSAAWRWAAHRPRVMVGLALPSPHWLPGIIAIDGLWERESYGVAPASADPTPAADERRRIGLSVGDWPTSWLRWQVSASSDRLREHGGIGGRRAEPRAHLALNTAVDVRLAEDRLAFTVSGGWWTPFDGTSRFATADIRGTWRSTNDTTRHVWSVATAYAVASRAAPPMLWQGAGTGQGRDALLRAHPLLDNGIVTGPVFGRAVVSGSVELARPVARTPAASLSIAGFVDSAQAWHRLSGSQPSPLYVDAGFGIRAQVPRLGGGGIRIDVARGLRGGGTTLSASWRTSVRR